MHKLKYLLLSFLLIMSGCEEGDKNADFKMISMSKSNIGIKNTGPRDIQGCNILVNGASGFIHDPGRSAFLSGQSRMFSMTRFYSRGHRKFDPRVDRVERVTVSCSLPKVSALVFDNSGVLTNF